MQLYSVGVQLTVLKVAHVLCEALDDHIGTHLLPLAGAAHLMAHTKSGKGLIRLGSTMGLAR
jgi:hypothetical protein